MARVLVVATAGAGGDLQPLVAAGLALEARRHDVTFLGDESVRRALLPVKARVELLPREVDLGPRLIAAIRDAMSATGGDMSAAGSIVMDAMERWAHDAAVPVGHAIQGHRPDLLLSSLFGVEVLGIAAPSTPWAIINSTFYLGPTLQRPLEQDVGARAIPLIARYASLLGDAPLVLHATDKEFDYSFTGLPDRHHYCGPLGIWEPPVAPPVYLTEDGDPWVLVSISSQLQDDMPIASAAVQALASEHVRVLVTVGPDHDPAELTDPPENVRVERTVSHAEVLKRGNLLISHAGHGSVMKALWYGRPMVLVPWGRDQPGVAARAAALGVAEIIQREHADPETISAAIGRVLTNADMRKTVEEHAERLHGTDPPADAAALLESLLD